MTKARRPHSHVITALKRRYGQCKGQLADLLCDRDQVKADMGHLAAVLAMFEPDADLAAIPAIRPYKPHRGRWNRTAMDILRRANHPMKTFELARLVMSAQGVEPDRRTMLSIGISLYAVLMRLRAQGLVIATGKPKRWAISQD
jgi:hypothetical protein